MSNYQIIKQGHGQYQLLDGGYDAFGELVSLKECKAYIINRQQRERTFNNAKLVKVMAKWADCSADVAQGLLGDVVTYAYTDDMRKMNKRPSYLIEYLNAREHAKDQYRANSARLEAEQGIQFVTKLYAIRRDTKHEDLYTATISIGNSDFNSTFCCSLESMAKRFSLSIEQLTPFIK